MMQKYTPAIVEKVYRFIESNNGRVEKIDISEHLGSERSANYAITKLRGQGRITRRKDFHPNGGSIVYLYSVVQNPEPKLRPLLNFQL